VTGELKRLPSNKYSTLLVPGKFCAEQVKVTGPDNVAFDAGDVMLREVAPFTRLGRNSPARANLHIHLSVTQLNSNNDNPF
jgi:hypothetical protein